MKFFPLAVLAAALAVSGHARAAETPGLTVVELFTSQGCSSCPPADAVLLELSRGRGDVLPLAFHVTYWNNLGWRDPFSFTAATTRQRDYAAAMRLSSIYTPQMVVNGHIDVVGSDRPAVLSAIGQAGHDRQAAAVKLSRADGQMHIDIRPGDAAAPAAARVWLIGYDTEHRTAVGRGENGGRSLLEANIVRSMIDMGPWSSAAAQLRHDVPEGEHGAVIVQAADGHIIGAAREAPGS